MIRVTALSFVLTSIFDWAAARASRWLLGVDASQTLGGTLATRAAAWCIAWMVTRPTRERTIDPPRLPA